MIAKLIAYGSNRKEAIERMKRAIDDYKIIGVTTTLDFCSFVLNHDAFVSGNFDTHFVNKFFKPGQTNVFSEDEMIIASLLAVRSFQDQSSELKYNNVVSTNVSNWKQKRLEPE